MSQLYNPYIGQVSGQQPSRLLTSSTFLTNS